jgi:hypothetical protein
MNDLLTLKSYIEILKESNGTISIILKFVKSPRNII